VVWEEASDPRPHLLVQNESTNEFENSKCFDHI
jgi:hypothetical protein